MSCNEALPRTTPRQLSRLLGPAAALWLVSTPCAFAQEPARRFVGGLFGVSTLSADARALVDASAINVSLYGPENGPALNLFAGAHLTRYFTVQASYVWNANDLTLVSVAAAQGGQAFYEQRRNSRQHALVADALAYFRDFGSRLRPYLSVGAGVVRLETDAPEPSVNRRFEPPPAISATRAVLRVAVGMDVALGDWRFRYTFSESLSGNPISEELSPPAPRNLANFQNLFGIFRQF